MFCPKCKSIMLPQQGKKVITCGCGHKQAVEKITITEITRGKNSTLAVVEKETTINTIVDASCPKCGPVKAEYWEIQTRSADEPPTRFHKCLKCNHTWREYK